MKIDRCIIILGIGFPIICTAFLQQKDRREIVSKRKVNLHQFQSMTEKYWKSENTCWTVLYKFVTEVQSLAIVKLVIIIKPW